MGVTTAVFQGHGLIAGDPTRHESWPSNRDIYYRGIVEPNAWGASALRELCWNAISRTKG